VIKRIRKDRDDTQDDEIEIIVDNRDGTKSHYYLPKRLADMAYPSIVITTWEKLKHILRL